MSKDGSGTAAFQDAALEYVRGQSGTPRTDAAICKSEHIQNVFGFKEHDRKYEYVDAKFARRLELELADARVKAATMKIAADGWKVCDCSLHDPCILGRPRTLLTTEFDRCVLPVGTEVRAAVLAEREACAKIAWNHEPDENGPIETEIRARSQ